MTASDFFSWLDRLDRYWTIGLILAGIAALLALLPARRAPGWLFALAIVVCMLFWRWPPIVHNQQLLNPDESQMLAGAITLQHDPVYWRSVDGTTHGPLCPMAVLVVRLFGAPVNYVTGRLIGTLLMAVAVIGCWLSLRAVMPERLARVASLGPLAFLATTSFWDFVQYSSEQVPVALLALATAALAVSRNAVIEGRAALPGWYLTGLMLGALPFAKLQAVPPGAWIGLGAMAVVWLESSARRTRDQLIALFAGTATVPLLFLSLLAVTGQLGEFWQAYIINNVEYATITPIPPRQIIADFWKFGATADSFNSYLFAQLAVLLLGGWAVLRWPRRWLPPFLFALGLLASSLYCVVTPGRTFQHYLHFLIIPVALASSIAGAALIDREWEFRPSWIRPTLLAVLGLIVFGPLAIWNYQNPSALIGQVRHARRNQITDLRKPVSLRLLQLARPGEGLAHWGWMPKYYVETGLWHATREAHTSRQIEKGPMQEYYRSRFLADVKRTQPPLFIDSVGPGSAFFGDRPAQGHETFAALREYIAAHYRLVDDLEGTRIYLRSDRETSAGPLPRQ